MIDDEQKAKQTLTEIGRAIGNNLSNNYGFVLMIFETGTEGSPLNYISNCQREDVIKVMAEFIQKTKDSWDKDRADGVFGVGSKN